jgi:putative zinc finger/helix-turn-helix YgiT family protein
MCPQCGAKEKPFETGEVDILQSFHGEELTVHTDAEVCRKCGLKVLSDGQADELRRKTADAYRAKHGLLTSDEIVARREALNLTQARFSKHLGVDVKISRQWETWRVQTITEDQLLREKTVQPSHVVNASFVSLKTPMNTLSRQIPATNLSPQREHLVKCDHTALVSECCSAPMSKESGFCPRCREHASVVLVAA